MDADGSNQEVLTDGYDPTWSPDGTTILFNREGGTAWAMAPDGTDQRLVLENAYATAWQPAEEELPLPDPYATGEPDPDPEPIPDGEPEPGEPEPGEPEPPADNRKPVCRKVRTTPHALPWRPDRRMHPVRLSGGKDPDGDRVQLTVVWVGQDEPVQGRGDHTAPDANWTAAPRVALIRNERSRHGDGRVYWVDYSLTDPYGARCIGTVKVKVRRHKKRAAIASPFYASSVLVPAMPEG
jgi:hypothetical protein